MELTPQQLTLLAKQVKQLLASESQGVGEVPVVASLDYVFSLPTLERKGENERVVEAPLSLLRVSLRKTPTAIEWRQGDEGTWQPLIPLSDITGPQGERPVFRSGNKSIEWKYENEGEDAWKELVSYDVLKLKFTDLTAQQVQSFWASIPEDMVSLFQQPATEAAEATLAVATAVEEAETKRKEAETLRVSAEQARASAEQARLSAEQARASQETEREQAETLRAANESSRAENERARLDEEQARGAAEVAREAAETDRQASEIVRQRQENQRQQQTEEALQQTAEALQQTAEAAQRLNDLSDHRDEIRAGYWWAWNETTQAWYNTGERANGNVLFATFELNPSTGQLTLFTDEDYAGIEFQITEKGELQVLI